jgi:hypothetical protein
MWSWLLRRQVFRYCELAFFAESAFWLACFMVLVLFVL